MTKDLMHPKPLNISKIKDSLRTKILGRPLLFFRELDSTNDMAKELAKKDTKEGIVVIAEIQTKGRGRLERKWISPRGGLWFSLVLRPKAEPRHASKITLLASVAVASTLNRMFKLKAQIKWPNDVLIAKRKVCGILINTETKGKMLDFAIVGIGLNTNFNPDALSSRLRKTSTTLKEELKREVENGNLLCSLLEEIETLYIMFNEGKFNTILDKWRSLASFLHSYVEIVNGKEKIEGRAIDIDENGALVVKLKDQTLTRVTTGDLIIRQK